MASRAEWERAAHLRGQDVRRPALGCCRAGPWRRHCARRSLAPAARCSWRRAPSRPRPRHDVRVGREGPRARAPRRRRDGDGLAQARGRHHHGRDGGARASEPAVQARALLGVRGRSGSRHLPVQPHAQQQRAEVLLQGFSRDGALAALRHCSASASSRATRLKRPAWSFAGRDLQPFPDGGHRADTEVIIGHLLAKVFANLPNERIPDAIVE